MGGRVAIVGAGYWGFQSLSPDLSYREMIFEAACRAYTDAGLEPKDIDAFVCSSEDFLEGYSIADEYCNDQLGAILKPVHTVAGDFLYSLINAYMMILTEAVSIVAVEAHSKASNLVTPNDILAFALDPVYNRSLEVSPYFVAGLEMSRYLFESGTTREQCARVVVNNRYNALKNGYAGHGARLSIDEVLSAEMVCSPLSRLDISPPSDGAVVMVLAAEDRVRSLSDKPLWLRGVGWCSETSDLHSRDWGEAVYTRFAAEMAYRKAGIRFPRKEIDLVEISDEFSYKELQHLEALGFCRSGEAGKLLEEGGLEENGELPVNLSGGSQGVGHLFEASGGQRLLEVVLQLRGEAGARQRKNLQTGLAQSWRGIPTTSGAVVIISN